MADIRDHFHKPGKYIFILLFISSIQLYGQLFYEPVVLNTDSLHQILAKTKGTPHISTLVMLSEQTSVNNPDTSLYFAKQAYRLAENYDNRYIQMKTAVTLSQAWHRKGDYPKAVRYGLDGQRMAFEQKDTAYISKAVTCVVLSYLYSGNYDFAINNARLVYRALKNSSNPAFLFDLNIRVGWVYLMSEKWREAIRYFKRCDSIENNAQGLFPAFVALNNKHLGACYKNLKQFDTALFYYLKADSIYLAMGGDKIPNNMLSIAQCYQQLGAIDSADFYGGRALRYSKIEGYPALEGYASILLGDLQNSSGNWRNALMHFETAVNCGKWILENASLTRGKDPHAEYHFTPEQYVPEYSKSIGLALAGAAHNKSYTICKKQGLAEQALWHYEEWHKITKQEDSLAKWKSVLEMGTRYETERKDEELLRLSQEKELANLRLSNTRILLLVLVIFVVLSTVISLLLARQYRMRILQETVSLKHKLFRAQMNPHFIFNSLSSIQGFILEQDNISAATYLSRFSKLVRNILTDSQEELILVQKEIETIEHYLELQKVRYFERFDFTIHQDEALEELNIMIPPLLIQPFVENAIEHGIRHKKTKGNVIVSFRIKHKSLFIEVIDDGVGRERSFEIEKENRTGASLSTALIAGQLRMMNRRKGIFGNSRKITMTICNLTDEKDVDKGTHITIEIPVENSI